MPRMLDIDRSQTPPNNGIDYLPQLYFAFGANLNKRSMDHRCPNAVPYGTFKLKNHQLIFRGVADVVPSPGDNVYGVLWYIDKKCLKSLDRFEGYPVLYDYEFFRLPSGEKVFYYKMTTMDPEDVDEPGRSYYSTIEQGYRDFGLPLRELRKALEVTEKMIETREKNESNEKKVQREHETLLDQLNDEFDMILKAIEAAEEEQNGLDLSDDYDIGQHERLEEEIDQLEQDLIRLERKIDDAINDAQRLEAAGDGDY